MSAVAFLGGAWFMITFGGIAKRMLFIGLVVTFLMFTPFTVFLSMMFIAMGLYLGDWVWPILILGYATSVSSCIIYDTLDGMRAGFDIAMLKQALAAVLFYKQQGVPVPEDD